MICEFCCAEVQVLLFGQRLLLCASCYGVEQDFRVSVLRHRLSRAVKHRHEEDVATLLGAIRFLQEEQA